MAQNNNDSISFTNLTTTDFMEVISGGTIQWQFSNSSLCYNKSICKNLFQWNNIVSIIPDAALVAPDEQPPSWYIYSNGKWQNAFALPEYSTPILPTLIASGGIGTGGSGGGSGTATTNPNPLGNTTIPPPVKPAVDDEIPDSTASLKKDCAGVKGGTAYKDYCDSCVGGTTGKVPCASSPCEQIDSLENDNNFKQQIQYLKTKTNLNYEVGNVYINSNGSSNFSQDYNGVADSGFIDITPPLGINIDGYLHSHYTGLMSIFSATDLKAIIQLYQGGYIGSLATFTIGVVTASNTVYLIKIANKTNFLTFANKWLANEVWFMFFEKQYTDKYKIKEIKNGGNTEDSEKGFLQLMVDYNMGVKLFKGNDSLDDYKPLGLDNNGNVIEKPCKN